MNLEQSSIASIGVNYSTGILCSLAAKVNSRQLCELSDCGRISIFTSKQE